MTLPHLVPCNEQALGQLVYVILHAAKVWVEKVTDHDDSVASRRAGGCCCDALAPGVRSAAGARHAVSAEALHHTGSLCMNTAVHMPESAGAGRRKAREPI